MDKWMMALQFGGFVLALIGLVWGIFIWIDKKLEKRFELLMVEVKKIPIIDRKVDKLDSRMKKHIKQDLKDKVKHYWHDLKSRRDNNEEISVLELSDASELVDNAREYVVNGETTPMQSDIKRWYKDALNKS